MYDYANLPTLVLNQIFGYLSVKERIKAKSVCRSWKAEIELREQKRDTLVLHIGPYPWNIRWTETNNRHLMKFENSFEMKHLTFLNRPMTRELLNKIKKLAIVQLSKSCFDLQASNLQDYLGYFKCCEELEIRDFGFGGTSAFDLPKLKMLLIKNCLVKKLVLNCPSLEVLFWNMPIPEVHFQSATKLKRLICYGCPAIVTLDGEVFESVLYLNLFCDQNERVSDHLLDRMPKLKRFVLHSRDRQTDLEIIRSQQKRLGLKNLEVLLSSFRDPVEVALNQNGREVVGIDEWIDDLFENYSKLEESSLWGITVDYSKLFNKFKILPSNFFERFHELFGIEISAVTNYRHLFGFLKCCSFVQQLNIHLNSKVDVDLILCQMMPLLHPSLKRVVIVGKCPSSVLKMDLAFLRLFNLTALRLESTLIPTEFVRKVAAKKGAHLQSIMFVMSTTGRYISIFFHSQSVLLLNSGEGFPFASVDQLIIHMQSDPYLRSFLL